MRVSSPARRVDAHLIVSLTRLSWSLGCVYSCGIAALAPHPASIAPPQFEAEQLIEVEAPAATLHLSIGFEHLDDLIAEREQALATVHAARRCFSASPLVRQQARCRSTSGADLWDSGEGEIIWRARGNTAAQRKEPAGLAIHGPKVRR
jgi:hypothetical protein